MSLTQTFSIRNCCLFLVVTLLSLLAINKPVGAGLFSDSWHYKLTVTIDTPDGPKTGSVVREVILGGGFNAGAEMGRHREVRGEAVAIDLGEKGYVFSTVSGDYGYVMFFHQFPEAVKEGKKILTPLEYPDFARFSNRDDPLTVQRICVPERCEKQKRALKTANVKSFSEAVGSGVAVKEVSIEVTKEPVTWGIESLLPWLPERLREGGRYLGAPAGTCCTDPSGTLLRAGAFSTGGYSP